MAKLTRSFDSEVNRYDFDFVTCNYKNGWAQMDTKQDASYYGVWVNPLILQIMTYAEGDITLEECTDEADFVQALTECAEWQKSAGHFKGIDCMCSQSIIDAFHRMGLSRYLWPDQMPTFEPIRGECHENGHDITEGVCIRKHCQHKEY